MSGAFSKHHVTASLTVSLPLSLSPQATYDWLALDHRVIQDAVWKETAVNKINA